MKLVLASLFAAVFAAANNNTVQGGIGDSLYRVFTKYYPQPTTVAQAQKAGFAKAGSCIPGLGFPYTIKGQVSRQNPSYLYFTGAGQIAGVGVDVYGSVKSTLIQKGYFIQKSKGRYHISVTFRSKNEVCGSSSSNLPLGDRVVVNQGGIAVSLPLTESDAQNQKWHRGSCFDGMGWHYFKDLTTNSNRLSWVGANLLPVVTMYHNGQINAVFFASTAVQQSLTDTREWEPIPLPNKLMCGNTCDADCTFHDASIWSTQHWYFHNHKSVTCDRRRTKCQIAGTTCCEK